MDIVSKALSKVKRRRYADGGRSLTPRQMAQMLPIPEDQGRRSMNWSEAEALVPEALTMLLRPGLGAAYSVMRPTGLNEGEDYAINQQTNDLMFDPTFASDQPARFARVGYADGGRSLTPRQMAQMLPIPEDQGRRSMTWSEAQALVPEALEEMLLRRAPGPVAAVYSVMRPTGLNEGEDYAINQQTNDLMFDPTFASDQPARFARVGYADGGMPMTPEQRARHNAEMLQLAQQIIGGDQYTDASPDIGPGGLHFGTTPQQQDFEAPTPGQNYSPGAVQSSTLAAPSAAPATPMSYAPAPAPTSTPQSTKDDFMPGIGRSPAIEVSDLPAPSQQSSFGSMPGAFTNSSAQTPSNTPSIGQFDFAANAFNQGTNSAVAQSPGSFTNAPDIDGPFGFGGLSTVGSPGQSPTGSASMPGRSEASQLMFNPDMPSTMTAPTYSSNAFNASPTSLGAFAQNNSQFSVPDMLPEINVTADRLIDTVSPEDKAATALQDPDITAQQKSDAFEAMIAAQDAQLGLDPTSPGSPAQSAAEAQAAAQAAQDALSQESDPETGLTGPGGGGGYAPGGGDPNSGGPGVGGGEYDGGGSYDGYGGGWEGGGDPGTGGGGGEPGGGQGGGDPGGGGGDPTKRGGRIVAHALKKVRRYAIGGWVDKNPLIHRALTLTRGQ